MSATEKLLIDVLGLPQKARAAMAKKLLASLEENGPSEKIEQAWKKEALRRYKAFKGGNIKGRAHRDVMRDAYKLTATRAK